MNITLFLVADDGRVSSLKADSSRSDGREGQLRLLSQ